MAKMATVWVTGTNPQVRTLEKLLASGEIRRARLGISVILEAEPEQVETLRAVFDGEVYVFTDPLDLTDHLKSLAS